jgi:hypothetical protein
MNTRRCVHVCVCRVPTCDLQRHAALLSVEKAFLLESNEQALHLGRVLATLHLLCLGVEINNKRNLLPPGGTQQEADESGDVSLGSKHMSSHWCECVCVCVCVCV